MGRPYKDPPDRKYPSLPGGYGKWPNWPPPRKVETVK